MLLNLLRADFELRTARCVDAWMQMSRYVCEFVNPDNVGFQMPEGSMPPQLRLDSPAGLWLCAYNTMLTLGKIYLTLTLVSQGKGQIDPFAERGPFHHPQP